MSLEYNLRALEETKHTTEIRCRKIHTLQLTFINSSYALTQRLSILFLFSGSTVIVCKLYRNKKFGIKESITHAHLYIYIFLFL